MLSGFSSQAHSRRAMRRVVDLPCQVVSSRAESPIDYNASDLSLDGMWLGTSEPLRTGETVVVCFDPPDARRLRTGWMSNEILVFARVVRVQTHAPRPGSPATAAAGMALELLDLCAAERRRLGQWLSAACGPRLRLDRSAPTT
jgi:hypothetical protein